MAIGSSTALGTLLTLIDTRDLGYADADVNLLDGVYVYWHRTRGTSTAGDGTTLTTDKDWGVNELADSTIKIVGSTGSGQSQIILSNTAGPNSVITVAAFSPAAGADSEYEIYPDDVDLKRTARVDAGGLAAASGTLTFSPAVSAVIESQSDYSLGLLHFKLLIEAINWALSQMRYLAIGPLSLLADPDMETSGIGSWTGSNATPSKVTAAARVWGGLQALFVDNSGANGYAKSAVAVPVNEGELVFLSAIAQAVGASTAKLVLYDLDNLAEISPSPTGDEERHIELRYEYTIPIGCEEVEVRLQGVEAGADTYWDDVILLGANRKRHPLPAWIEVPEDIVSVGSFPSGSGGPDAYTFKLEETNWREWPYWRPERRDIRASQPFHLLLDPAPIERMYVIAWRRFPALTGDADTTVADETAVLAGARVYLRKQLAEGAVLNPDPVILAGLLATQAEDERAWDKATERTGGAPVTRIRGLRKFKKR
ncbi:hypothetical protein LCGC14_1086050 [marine sediment metagenome]|uniref:Uncharacterized protein n=1 Tax=marine sediment metagenome TaxID=412755 RepID=A0A0F9MDY5_9ZZZZ